MSSRTEILGYETLAAAERGFAWDQRWNLFDGNRERFNIAHECIDRHTASGRGDDVAVRVVHGSGEREQFLFGEIAALSSMFANALAERGIGPGASVVMVLDPGLHYLVALFGTLKSGAMIVPTSTVLSVDSVLRYRVSNPGVRLLIVEESLVGQIDRAAVPSACEIVSAGELLDWIDPYPGSFHPTTSADDEAFIVYSSGTTGTPKATTLRHRALTTYAVVVGSWVLNLQRDDTYLTAYSPGWLGGFGWGLWVPLSLGVAAGLYSGSFKPEVFGAAVDELQVTALHCAPTAYRKLLRSGWTPERRLKTVAYTGESMEPELAVTIEERLGQLPRGQYGATEVGFLALDYAYPDYRVRPGSVGKPLIGTTVAVVDDDDTELAIGEVGWVTVRRGDRYIRLGDKGCLDGDGYLWFRGRGDDVIISAGYTIGAQEVEEVLRRHPAVADVAVIGEPDPERGAVVRAFVQLEPGWDGDDALNSELTMFSRTHLGSHAYPRSISFVSEFDRGEGGKIRRSALRGG